MLITIEKNTTFGQLYVSAGNKDYRVFTKDAPAFLQAVGIKALLPPQQNSYSLQAKGHEAIACYAEFVGITVSDDIFDMLLGVS